MKYLSIIYQLFHKHNLGEEYINFLLNIMAKNPDYTKNNGLVLMYRMRLTAIIMLEHYLQFKNAKLNL